MKPETHAAITDLALAACAGSVADGLFGRDAFRAAIRRGTEREDAWWEASRALNWHFYPANDRLGRAVLGFMQPTSRQILRHRERALLDGLARGPSEALFTLFGRVLHHIQDMSTPSHVVPVYHGPGLADAYEDFLVEQWPAVAAALGAPAQGVGDAGSEHPFADLYESAARRTLAELAAPATDFTVVRDGQADQPGGTGLFWRPHDPSGARRGKYHDHGFGSFGELGPHYGREAVTAGGHVYRVEHGVYLGLAARFVGHAMADSLTACRRLAKLLGAG